MNADIPFRIAVGVFLLLAGSVGGYHRWRARSGERISHREEGYLFAVVLRLSGLALWVSVLLFLVEPDWVAWAQLPVPAGLRWTGAALGAVGLALMTWTMRTLGKNLTDTVVTRTDATLVTSGPYRWVRHPFYVTAGVLMLSVGLVSANALVMFSSLAVLILLVVRTTKEEQFLLAKFGKHYRHYMATTGRFWPITFRRR